MDRIEDQLGANEKHLPPIRVNAKTKNELFMCIYQLQIYISSTQNRKKKFPFTINALGKIKLKKKCCGN